MGFFGYLSAYNTTTPISKIYYTVPWVLGFFCLGYVRDGYWGAFFGFVYNIPHHMKIYSPLGSLGSLLNGSRLRPGSLSAPKSTNHVG